jgi:hypothetical protein
MTAAELITFLGGVDADTEVVITYKGSESANITLIEKHVTTALYGGTPTTKKVYIKAN